MLIPSDIRRPAGAVFMTEGWWDAEGNPTEGPVLGGRGIQSFFDAHEQLVETRHFRVDAMHTPEGQPTTGGERA